MLRTCLALFMVFACAQATAQNARATSATAGACQDAETIAREEVAQAGTADPKTAAARGKYAKPTTNTPSGSGGSDESLPRLRGSKWHSFLPGMFR